MAKLRLLDAEKARTFGVPDRDTTDEEAFSILKKGSTLDEAAIKYHIENAIAAGVYVRETREPRPTRSTIET